MGSKKAFEPGHMITTFTGQVGMVLSREEFLELKDKLKEGRRPGHYFSPGCCANPDYVIQVPVLFEDGTYDVMRALNIKRANAVSEEKRASLQRLVEEKTD